MILRRREKHRLNVLGSRNVSFAMQSRGRRLEEVKKEVCFQYPSQRTIFFKQIDMNQSRVDWNKMDNVCVCGRCYG